MFTLFVGAMPASSPLQIALLPFELWRGTAGGLNKIYASTHPSQTAT